MSVLDVHTGELIPIRGQLDPEQEGTEDTSQQDQENINDMLRDRYRSKMVNTMKNISLIKVRPRSESIIIHQNF